MGRRGNRPVKGNMEHAKISSRDEILDLTHGREAGPYDRTVDMQITRLRRKLGEDPRLPSMIRSVRGVGYMLACPVES